MESLSNRILHEVFIKVAGNVKELHRYICKLLKKTEQSVNSISLHYKAKKVINEIKRLKKNRDKSQLETFYRQNFELPKPNLKRKSNEIISDDVSKSKQNKKSVCGDSCSERIKYLSNKVKQLNGKIRHINISKLNLQIKRQRKYINDLKVSKEKHKIKKNIFSKTILFDKSTQCNSMKNIISDLKSSIDHLECMAEEKIENLTEETKMFTFRNNTKGKPFTDRLRQVYYCFRSRKIGLEHIAPLIISVLSLADITLTLDDLPSISTAAKLTSELGIVARNHVKDEKITMQRDATTKKGRHFVGLEIATGEKILTAGLREVSNGKASTYVSCTNEIIKDIEITTKSNDKILPKVKSFMTDRSATEHKANTLLSAEIHDENNNTETHNFKCAVHPLLQFSDVCTKQIVKLEKDKTVNIDGSGNMCSTSFLLKCVSKLFFKDGTGDPALDYIVRALSNDNILAILRALGLISKIFTEPYWKKAGGEIETALGMGNIYNRLVEFLEICIANPELVLIENGIKLFYGPDFPDDDIYSYLFKPCNVDDFTKDIIVKFCSELKVKCMQLFKDFMPTGKYYEPNDEILNICKSCPSNNISVERLMAKLDNCIVNAPTYNTNSMESVIISHGKAFDVSKLSLNLLEFIQNQQIHTPSTTVMQEDIFLKPDLLVGKSFIHTWTDNGQDEQWRGKIYSYDGGLFEVQYNDKDGKFNQDSELYELTCEEMKTDFTAGYFVFEGIMINLSTMSHDNMHETDYSNKSGE
ncbi:unnamed protein product [Mytilus edulis]|uniref:Uncharacterized protein n=1 Tax=Mytilus edulis TaxID=6550 RepID=A0A8S3T7C6_MYTED|nr:unnamed protein product [Mytilus edulis]